MTGKVRRISYDNAISELAVMGNVTVSHNQVMITYCGYAQIFTSGAVYGNIFPDIVIITDDYPGFFTLKLKILRDAAYAGKLGNLAVFPDM